MTFRTVPLVPGGAPVLASVTTETSKGLPVRLFASSPFRERVFGYQVIVATDLSVPEDTGVLPLDNALGYARAAWVSLATIAEGAPTLGAFNGSIKGRLSISSEKELAEYLSGRPYLHSGPPDPMCFASRRARSDAFDDLWVYAERRNVAYIEYVDSYVRRQGLASLMYPALASVLKEEGLPLVASGLQSDDARGFWSSFGQDGAVFQGAGFSRPLVTPSSLSWDWRSAPVVHPGAPLKASDSPPPPPKLPLDVTLDDGSA